MSFRIAIALLPVNTFNQKPSPCLFLSVPTETQGCCREAAERLRASAGDTLLIVWERLWADSVLQLQGVQLGQSDQRTAEHVVEAEETITHTHTQKEGLCAYVCVCLCGQQMGARRITKLILNTSQSTNYWLITTGLLSHTHKYAYLIHTHRKVARSTQIQCDNQ